MKHTRLAAAAAFALTLALGGAAQAESNNLAAVEAPPVAHVLRGGGVPVDVGSEAYPAFSAARSVPVVAGTDLLVREGDIAGDYLERLLDIADVDGDIDMDVESNRAVVAIVGEGLDALIGPHGQTLEALQELTRLAVIQQTGVRSRLMLDIAGYRDKQRATLRDLAGDAIAEVQASGESVRLAPMNPYQRKIVHDAVAAAGLVSESEGEEPQRRVVVLPRS